MKFAMWHVKRTAVIWNLLKMLSFRERNAKIVQCLRHHTVYWQYVGRTTVTCSINQRHLNLYDSLA